MKKSVLLIVIMANFFLLSTSSAGEIRVYDAKDQFLGILLDSSVYNTTVFIPSLGVVTEITNHPSVGSNYEADIREHGNGNNMCCTDKVVFSDPGCTGTPHLDAAYPALIKYRCDGKYYKTNGHFKHIYPGYIRWSNCDPYEYGDYGGYYQELEETPLPFNIPLALPLKFKYSKGATVIPLIN